MPENRADIKKLRSRIMAKHLELVGSECKHRDHVYLVNPGERRGQKLCVDCGAILEESWEYDDCRVNFNYQRKLAIVNL